jgi:aconitate hydratase
MYLGVRAVIAKSYARMHHTNLVNFGILPLVYADEADYGRLQVGDALELPNVASDLRAGDTVKVRNASQDYEFTCRHNLSPRQVDILLAGGLLNHVKGSAL